MIDTHHNHVIDFSEAENLLKEIHDEKEKQLIEILEDLAFYKKSLRNNLKEVYLDLKKIHNLLDALKKIEA